MVDFADKLVALVGRLTSMSHRQASAEIVRFGGSARRGLARGAAVAVVGHGAHTLLRSGRLERMLAKADALGVRCLSENGFLAAVGMGPSPDAANRTIPVEILSRRTGLDSGTARILEMFDIIEPVEENCGFQDLAAAERGGEAPCRWSCARRHRRRRRRARSGRAPLAGQALPLALRRDGDAHRRSLRRPRRPAAAADAGRRESLGRRIVRGRRDRRG